VNYLDFLNLLDSLRFILTFNTSFFNFLSLKSSFFPLEFFYFIKSYSDFVTNTSAIPSSSYVILDYTLFCSLHVPILIIPF